MQFAHAPCSLPLSKSSGGIGNVLAVLQGPWRASGGGGLALEHNALRLSLLPFSAIHLVASSSLRERSYVEFGLGGLHFVIWRRKWDGGEVAAHGLS